MDLYFRKTRRPVAELSKEPIKSQQKLPRIVPPEPLAPVKKRPKNFDRLSRARVETQTTPPPLTRKLFTSREATTTTSTPTTTTRTPHSATITPIKTPTKTPSTPVTPTRTAPKPRVVETSPHKFLSRVRRELFKEDEVHPQQINNNNTKTNNKNDNFKKPTAPAPLGTSPLVTQSKEKKVLVETKIKTGPLAGVSTSLLDIIRAKEAAAKATSPEELRQRELLGIAPTIARIVPTIFIANKKDVMLYDKVVEKCVKGLKSNYTSSTIVECLDLMDKIAPEWVSIVEISRGKFIRFNKDKYTIPQLLEAIVVFKKKK